jgi:hypothetical protein
MIFDEEYPDAEPQTQIEVEGDSFFKVARADLCWNCHRATHWISHSFYAFICSQKCSTEKWNEYFEATRK